MVKKTFIKKDNVVVMFKQTDREMSATVLTNYGCTYKEIKEHFSCKEQGNAFYMLMNMGSQKLLKRTLIGL